MSMRMIRCGGCGIRKSQSGTSFATRPDGTRVRSCSTACDAKITGFVPEVAPEVAEVATDPYAVVTLWIGKPYTDRERRSVADASTRKSPLIGRHLRTLTAKPLHCRHSDGFFTAYLYGGWGSRTSRFLIVGPGNTVVAVSEDSDALDIQMAELAAGA